MTLQNSRRLYAHFLSIGKTDEANALLEKYPVLGEEIVEVKVEEPTEELEELEEEPKSTKKQKK